MSSVQYPDFNVQMQCPDGNVQIVLLACANGPTYQAGSITIRARQVHTSCHSMAFPFEPSQLRAQLRAFALSMSDGEFDSAATIVKPLKNDLFHDYYNRTYLRNFRPRSPPIPFELPATEAVPKRHSLKLSARRHKKTKSRAKRASLALAASTVDASRLGAATGNSDGVQAAAERDQSVGDAVDSSFGESSESAQSVGASLLSTLLVVDGGRRKSKERKNPLSKLFLKAKPASVELQGGSLLTADDTLLEHSVEASLPNYSISESDMVTIEDTLDHAGDLSFPRQTLVDGESVIVAEMEGHKLDDTDLEPDALDNESSSDSAFTDIEADSMIDMGLAMMYEYTVPESYMLKGDGDLKFSAKLKRIKSGKQSGDMLLNKSKSTASMSFAQSVTDGLRPDRTPIFRRRTSFTFEKLYDAVTSRDTTSNLSAMIQARSKSANVNPLHFFAFANSVVEDAHKAQVDIFVPPDVKPVIKSMEIGSNVSVFDCIGYVLLSLSKLPEYAEHDMSLMDPNRWRMELIDEDGELYDSDFGVLERTRLLSSYNCPNCLALCKVTNPLEITTNERQSPLPLEFRQNLETYSKRRLMTSNLNGSEQPVSPLATTDHHTDSIEIKVGNIPNTSSTNYVSYFVLSAMKVGDLLDLICSQNGVDPSRYMLAEVDVQPTREVHTLLTEGIEVEETTSWKQPLDNAETLAALTFNTFKLVPNIAQKIRPMTDVKADRGWLAEGGITPNSPTFTPAGITPPVKQLESRFHELAVHSEDELNVDSDDAEKEVKAKRKQNEPVGISTTKDQFSFGDLIHGKSLPLPTSLNTIYFKWKVYRKKSPIFNRIEKSLIIDGDYIHLAPTDASNWKLNLYENPFTASNQNSQHHHHHYLHHYNYSKYYNDTMMKTSSFHITQITKLKQYKQSKNPTHFKIVIKKESEQGGKETTVKKKYDLEAETVPQCEEIIEKIKWALQVYNMTKI